jgi:hypothetical protein
MFSNNVSVVAVTSVEIGDHCLIGDLVSIMDSDFHAVASDQRHQGQGAHQALLGVLLELLQAPAEVLSPESRRRDRIDKRDLYEQHPWMAQNLYKAFIQAQQKCYEDMEEAAALKVMLPWLLSEVEEAKAVLGEQFWPYGVEPNRPTIEALTQFSHEQGLAARRMKVEELFAPETLDEFSLW